MRYKLDLMTLPQFLISWFTDFFLHIRLSGDEIKKNLRIVYFLIFFYKKLGYSAIFLNNDSRPIRGPHL